MKFFLVIVFLLALTGGGEQMAVIHITNLAELQAMSDDLSADYILDNDIDASATSGWPAGFVPIGTLANPFTGSFDGGGFTISSLFINRPATDYVGLFGYVNTIGDIKDVTIANCDITGANYIGALAGRNNGNNAVSGCVSSGSILLFNKQSAGGLIGYNYLGSVSSCSSSVDITYGDIAIDSFTVQRIGGLIGYNQASDLSSCFATGSITLGSITGIGDSNYFMNIGGLIGRNRGANTIDNCYATGNIIVGDITSTGEDNYIMNIGGLLGLNREEDDVIITVSDCHSTGNITIGNITSGEANYIQNIGGLIGWNKNWVNSGTITLSSCYATGNIIIDGIAGGIKNKIQAVGGLVGEAEIDSPAFPATSDAEMHITNCYATGKVEIGDITGIVSDWEPNWIQIIGGLIGKSDSGARCDNNIDISNCYSTGDVETGNLTGDQDASVYVSSIGGLIGNCTYTDISQTYTSSNVTIGSITNTGADNGISNVGGFTGYRGLRGDTDDCYANGDVTIGNATGTDSSINNVGGFNGYLANCTLSNCYSVGAVTTGTASGGATITNIGGFCGDNYNFNPGTISNCFWDTETSGQAASDGGTGQTTTEMQTKSTFTDATWDFVTPIWKIYALLLSQQNRLISNAKVKLTQL